MNRVVALSALVFVLIVGACGGDDPSPSNPDASEASPAETSGPSEAQTDCPNELDVIGDPQKRRPDELSGDVDGDGEADAVRLYVDEQAPPMCAAFVVVEAAGGWLVTAIDEPQLSFDLGQPVLNSLVQIDGVGGHETTVDVLSGASTQFLAVFSVADGELQRVRFPGVELFGNGASVTHLDVVDCVGTGEVAVSTAVRETGRRYRTTRRLYEFDGKRWRKIGTERGLVDFDEFEPEFRGGSPFGSCR